MANPVSTLNQTLLAAAAQGAGATRGADLGLSTKFEAQLQVEVQFGGTITADPIVNAYRYVEALGTDVDTIAVYSFSIARSAGATKRASFSLPTGLWRIEIVNADGANGLTSTSILYATVDSVSF